ncbi:DNA-3-methyladenine glycosylase I [Paraflavitalea pollutisoli]|uniref:DNA-3-methyladenine glycosylase I n=1 Tax=Paraflavitalea pollutisoli TaxID=3034143 RepID=UPI0023ED99E2|nr:DNA-3-methyladenine glycosylase I [Paraflavitalea sp. H1-2-19X]
MATVPRKSYCDAVAEMEKGNVNIPYHDYEYGFPIHDDDELFARLVLEINQAGLSWITILKKKDNFFAAYNNFSIDQVARYTDKQVERLLADPGIIRNRLKINAAIENARRIRLLQQEFGSFQQWLHHHHPLTKESWTKLFKKTFLFTGGEIVHSFLMSIGYLPGAHVETCPIYKKVLKQKPAWATQR